jgi:hypothetical protein
VLIGAVANIANQRYYVKLFHTNNNRAVPEARLPSMMAGSLFLALGLFFFAWTSSKHVFWKPLYRPCVDRIRFLHHFSGCAQLLC